MHILISGLVNVETSVKVRRFPIDYYPIDYPFFGVESHVAGVAYNIAKALYLEINLLYYHIVLVTKKEIESLVS